MARKKAADKEINKTSKRKKKVEDFVEELYEDTEKDTFDDEYYEEEDEPNVDEITDEEIQMANELSDNNEDFENYEDFDDFDEFGEEKQKEKIDGRKCRKKEFKRVYDKSAKSEEIRTKFIDICERYKSENEEVRKEALNDAVNELTSFIHYVIKKKYSTYGKYYEDLVQEGTIGIMKGMEKYDPTKSLPTTFFNLYIIHEMSKYIDTEVNKTTSHYSSNLTKINRVIEKFEQQGKNWNPTDISVETGLNMETVTQCLNIKEYKNEMYYETDEVLEAHLTDHGKSPEAQYLENEKMATLYRAIGTLLPEEIQVLKYRYGLLGTEQLAYKEIAKVMNISIEKVRKYRHDAIRKLKYKSQMRNVFRDYIYDGENSTVNETEIAFIPEKVSTNMMKEIEELSFDFDLLN